ncbi:MAG: DNA-protecting protein DprA [Lewinellaceae bacterium]|nr:DNA-processing protein DprA [Saprospiraceae bacterium]MCB9314186.1 DNA-protecting protein DprA [Lewinellaceae bacterium]HRW76031.1 DNA-processing protein DprA [Saprospiraceae bacterium]
MESSLLYMIALSQVPKVGPILGRTLVAYCGSPEAVFRSSVRELARIPQIGLVIARSIQDTSLLHAAEQELRILEREGITGIHYLDERYPSRLAHFEESPLVIYLKGQPPLQHGRTIGVIGTRTPTPAGRIVAEELINGLAAHQVMVISGLAHGIDSTAHHAALSAGLPTIGILGHGFQTIYPAANRSLAKKMEGNSGLMTEYPFATLPDKDNFPMRNRVIAALSDALVVIESKERGGSMITAEFANRYHKDVFAVPGRVTDPLSKGCHLLIKRHKAHLLEHAEDLAEFMGWDIDDQKNAPPQAALFHDLDPDEQAIIDEIARQPELLIDDLGFRLQMPPSKISSSLLNLEFRGLVRTLPGKRYILSGN